MARDTGFYKRRRGILEHLESGKIGLLDLAIHDYLNLKANLVVGSGCSTPPGVCFSSAVAIHAICGREVSERAIRYSLEHLEKIGWIKRWHERGKRGNYPILICRSSVHDLAAVEYRVSGTDTADWRHPVLIPAADVPHFRYQRAGNREKRVERKKKNPAAKPAPPADPRHQPFVYFAYQSYESKHNRAPIWNGKDWKNLKTLLGNHNPEALPLAELKSRWSNFTASTEPFTEKQGDSLAYFCTNLDQFADGPILAAPQKDKTIEFEIHVGGGPSDNLQPPRFCICGLTATAHNRLIKHPEVWGKEKFDGHVFQEQQVRVAR